MNKLTQVQLAALRKFQAANPGCWKSRLNQSWLTGIYSFGDDSMSLQQIRNNFGPSWLAKFRLPVSD